MTLDNTKYEQAGVLHIVLGVLAFVGIALLTPLLRVLMLVFGA
ncbi:hypothetical protein [Aliidiomarina taiwanensis]|nr:hypothetical protein [Aliidiomarina taiwanensis]